LLVNGIFHVTKIQIIVTKNQVIWMGFPFLSI
jgi:hypothetical protein